MARSSLSVPERVASPHREVLGAFIHGAGAGLNKYSFFFIFHGLLAPI
jgi:hypothetical protein